MAELKGPDALRAELLDARAAGLAVPLFAFYGHTPPTDGSPGPWMASQFAQLGFVVNGQRYRFAEQWMMAEKATLFGDTRNREAILAARNPAECKTLGRKVQGFDEHVWAQHRYRIVAVGNWHKFCQNPAAAEWLASTAPATLVEAAACDTVWGVGLGVGDGRVAEPSQWRGLNLLGFALTEVRAFLDHGN